MSILKRILGICETKPPLDPWCWTHQNGRIEIDLPRAPELSRPGGAIRLEGQALPERVLIVYGTDGQFHAFRNKCRHMGRRMDPIPASAKIRCCSVSIATYDYSGKVVLGPARGPLKTYRVEAAEGKITILLN
jgi:nitrite reductase/ring-hydroxylating ferredoxin subunit